jgi:hypothetical protein
MYPMRRSRILIIVSVAVACCCFIPAAWFFKPPGRFTVGSNIRKLGLDKDPNASLRWAHEVREPIRQFLNRRKTNPAHFSGSVAVVRPGDRYYWSELSFLDGVVQPVWDDYADDESLARDLRVARSGRMSHMLDQTKNDWRITNHNSHFIDPTGPFTGEIMYPAGGIYPIGSWWFITVEADVIKSVRRELGLDAD